MKNSTNIKPTLLLFLLPLAGCVWQQSVEKPEPRPIFINECFIRSSAEREKLMAQADHGDAEACVELSNYYGFIELDHERSIYWLKKAVTFQPNNKLWKHNLKVLTTEEDTDD